ncbi:ankyrin repeat domain-containing protein [Shewanella sp. Isolate13]|uniref:ankyrin repeat domain-containing protein n=1 Tax=Shewanella sp. Isolate13 TaxID=2908531 RepID=UPI001EFD74ED|nr:ankyrin repeat domain-containing protein [Shewanella sp. Isolate13]MCG9731503.1 ankyrin repeat domain-containing protein [Shewanella sp. Isolate13]
MLSGHIFDGLELDDVLRQHLDELDSYDEPYFICMKLSTTADKAIKVLIPELDHIEQDIFAFKLAPQLLLLSLECEVDEIKSLSQMLLAAFEGSGITAQIAIFHHNCLGTPIETFKWSTQLLETLIEKSPNDSIVEFNDFRERGNWPGLSAYIEGREQGNGADFGYDYDENDYDEDDDDDDDDENDDRFDEDGFDKDGLDASGFTALIQAILDKDAALVAKMIANGADVNQGDWYKNTPLNHAVKSSTEEVVTLLLEAGANPNQTGSYGTRPLMIASFNGLLPILEQLLAKGAEVNHQGDEGETALTMAAGNSTKDVVALLLQAGANVNAITDDGNTALIHAVIGNYNERTAIVELLLANGAAETIHQVNIHDSTAMGLALDREHKEVIELLKQAM